MPSSQELGVKLTRKQLKWAEAYIGEANGNQTEAARMAGYSGVETVMGRIGSQNVRNEKIIAYIQAREAEIARTKAVTPEVILDWIVNIVKDAMASDDRVNALKGAELLGKYHGIWKERNLVEDVNEAARMEAKEREEAARIAQIRLRETG